MAAYWRGSSHPNFVSLQKSVIMCRVTGSVINAKCFSSGLTRPKISGAINHSRQTKLAKKKSAASLHLFLEKISVYFFKFCLPL
jgi:hypothetical protein